MFLTGAAAAAGTALINTVGNIAGFSAGYITGWLHDLTGGYLLPMCVVGGVMLLSALILGGLRASMKSPEALAAEDEREQAELAKFES